MLHSLVYVSRAVPDLSERDLLALRDQSIEHNTTVGVTGLLVHHHGTFLQDLEGPRHAVTDLYARIQRDVRHFDVTLVSSGPRAHRRFPRWSMAFTGLGGTPGTPEGLEGDPLDHELPEAAFVRELLDSFDTHD